jgi:hypothetical protein
VRVVAGVAASVLALLALASAGSAQRVSIGSYRNAVAVGAQRALLANGIRPRGRLSCVSAPPHRNVVTVRCDGWSVDGERLTVTGGAEQADTATPREWYTITVDDRVLARTDCLSARCAVPHPQPDW